MKSGLLLKASTHSQGSGNNKKEKETAVSDVSEVVNLIVLSRSIRRVTSSPDPFRLSSLQLKFITVTEKER
jgi:hypothetical protein